jgi:hypothetical protein
MAKYMLGQLVEYAHSEYATILRYTTSGDETVYTLDTEPRQEVAESEIRCEVARKEYIGGQTVPVMLDGPMAEAALDCILMLLENDFEAYGQDMCGNCEQELDANGDGHLTTCPVPARLAATKRLYRSLKLNFPEQGVNWNIDWLDDK